MVKLHELDGWRKPTHFEQQYIKGLLLPRAKSEKRQSGAGGILCLLLAFGIAVTCIDELREFTGVITRLGVRGVLLELVFLVILIALLVLAILGMRTCMRNYGKYYKYVTKGEFWVNEIEVYEDITPSGDIGYVGLISDSKGSRCNKQIQLLLGGKGERLCVAFGQDVNQDSRCIVVPFFEHDKKICQDAMKNYHKYIK